MTSTYDLLSTLEFILLDLLIHLLETPKANTANYANRSDFLPLR